MHLAVVQRLRRQTCTQRGNRRAKKQKKRIDRIARFSLFLVLLIDLLSRNVKSWIFFFFFFHLLTKQSRLSLTRSTKYTLNIRSITRTIMHIQYIYIIALHENHFFNRSDIFCIIHRAYRAVMRQLVITIENTSEMQQTDNES